MALTHQAARLLSAPLRRYANEEAALTREEAAHALLLHALGYRVATVTGVGGKCVAARLPSLSAPPLSYKSDMQIVSLAGLALSDDVTAYRAAGDWGELERHLSAGDFRMLWDNLEEPGSERALKAVSEAMVIARGLLALNRRPLDRLADALARHGSLDGDQVAAVLGDLDG